MPFSVFLEMSLTAALAVWSPGPNNILLLSSASKFGVKKNLKFMLGIWTGSLTIMTACGLFCKVLTGLVPGLSRVLPFVGALYLLYLAYQTLKRRPPSDQDTDKVPGYITGILLQLINVKIIIYGLTMFSSFILPNISSFLLVFPMAFWLMTLGAVGNLIWAFAGNVLRKFYGGHYRMINAVMAILLVWCALRVIGLI